MRLTPWGANYLQSGFDANLGEALEAGSQFEEAV